MPMMQATLSGGFTSGHEPFAHETHHRWRHRVAANALAVMKSALRGRMLRRGHHR